MPYAFHTVHLCIARLCFLFLTEETTGNNVTPEAVRYLAGAVGVENRSEVMQFLRTLDQLVSMGFDELMAEQAIIALGKDVAECSALLAESRPLTAPASLRMQLALATLRSYASSRPHNNETHPDFPHESWERLRNPHRGQPPPQQPPQQPSSIQYSTSTPLHYQMPSYSQNGNNYMHYPPNN
eukprot:PhM_4_TR16347/c0_g1_i1/m.56394